MLSAASMRAAVLGGPNPRQDLSHKFRAVADEYRACNSTTHRARLSSEIAGIVSEWARTENLNAQQKLVTQALR
jgi:hypothetical protein